MLPNGYDPVLPRKKTDLNERQMKFVHALIAGSTRREAVREAGYEVSDDASADSQASRLLSNAKVYAYYVDERAKVAAQAEMDGAKWVEYLRLIAVEAISERDWAGAVQAMRELGKYLGVYEKDHQQRQPTQQDADRIKMELEKLGLDLTRRNAPPHLRNGDGSGPHN